MMMENIEKLLKIANDNGYSFKNVEELDEALKRRFCVCESWWVEWDEAIDYICC